MKKVKVLDVTKKILGQLKNKLSSNENRPVNDMAYFVDAKNKSFSDLQNAINSFVQNRGDYDSRKILSDVNQNLANASDATNEKSYAEVAKSTIQELKKWDFRDPEIKKAIKEFEKDWQAINSKTNKNGWHEEIAKNYDINKFQAEVTKDLENLTKHAGNQENRVLIMSIADSVENQHKIVSTLESVQKLKMYDKSSDAGKLLSTQISEAKQKLEDFKVVNTAMQKVGPKSNVSIRDTLKSLVTANKALAITQPMLKKYEDKVIIENSKLNPANNRPGMR